MVSEREEDVVALHLPFEVTGCIVAIHQVRSGQVRSGQVRSECLMFTFIASCCSARLSRAQAIHLPIGPLKPRSGMEPVPRYKPSTYQPLTDDI